MVPFYNIQYLLQYTIQYLLQYTAITSNKLERFEFLCGDDMTSH